MLRKLAATLLIAAAGAWCGTAGAADDVSSVIASCARDNGPPDCPVTYQTVGAGDCLLPQPEGNRACLIRMASKAAAANDCNKAYRLVSACQCEAHQESAREALKAAGPGGVCSALKSGAK
jgi:hypothetical protein